MAGARTRAGIALGALLAAGAPVSAQQATVGQLLDSRGLVRVKRGSQPPSKAGLLFPLQAGDMVFVGRGGAAEVLVFSRGLRYVLAARSEARVGAGGVFQFSGPALRPRPRIVVPPRPPKGPPRRVMGLIVRDPRSTLVMSPDGGVRAVPVTLAWEGEPSAAVTVTIQDEAGAAVHTATVPAGERSYRVPDGVLTAGDYYRWSLSSPTDSGTPKVRGSAEIRVLLPAETGALTRLEASLKQEQAKDPADPSLLLALAQAYEQYRMWDVAVEAYDKVLRLRPNDAAVKTKRDKLAADHGRPASR